MGELQFQTTVLATQLEDATKKLAEYEKANEAKVNKEVKK